MVKIIRTENLLTGNIYEGNPLTDTHSYWVYNGLDCCLTQEILDITLPQLDNTTAWTY